MKFKQAKKLCSVAVLAFAVLCVGCASESVDTIDIKEEVEAVTIETSEPDAPPSEVVAPDNGEVRPPQSMNKGGRPEGAGNKPTPVQD